MDSRFAMNGDDDDDRDMPTEEECREMERRHIEDEARWAQQAKDKAAARRRRGSSWVPDQEDTY